MNGYQRVAAALRGEWPDTRPVMLHNFMMAAHEAGVPMSRYRQDPRAIADCFIRSVERYGYDGIVVDVDTATLAGAVGVPVSFPDDEPAICRGGRLNSAAEVRELEPANIAQNERVQIWLEAVRLLKAQFRDELYIRGNCDQAPFSLACAMRGIDGWMTDVVDSEKPDDVRCLLEYATDASIQFIRLMAATGAHMVSNGDSPAGPSMISPKLYRTFALPYERRLVEAAHGLGLPYMLHICGKTEPILDDMASSGADVLELDYKTDSRYACRTIADRSAFCGNIDPSGVLALGSADEVERATRELLDVFAGTPRLILNAGCAIPSTTPPENLETMIRVAREWTPGEKTA